MRQQCHLVGDSMTTEAGPVSFPLSPSNQAQGAKVLLLWGHTVPALRPGSNLSRQEEALGFRESSVSPLDRNIRVGSHIQTIK